ncbi:MAG: hypothetical protein AAF196_02600 [Planctomycetota bacterium]
MIRFALALLGAVLAAPIATLSSQTCGSGELLVKNDILPANPTAAQQVAIVPGLCDGEAAMSVIQTGGPVRVRAVSALFAANGGLAGVQALADVEIYDGATVNAAGVWTLGPRIFRLSDTGANLQLMSTGINVYTLPSTFVVQTTQPTLVVGIRIIQNLAVGSCAAGYQANLATDFGPACTPGRNIIDTLGNGAIDPATFLGFGIPLCPLFFRGDWVVRACVSCGSNAATTVVGAGSPSASFGTPTIGSAGGLPTVGSSTFQVTGANLGTFNPGAFLTIALPGTTPFPIPGGAPTLVLFGAPPFLATPQIPSDLFGTSSFPLAIPGGIGICGAELLFQWLVLDVSLPFPIQLASSEGLLVTIGL